MAVSKIRLSFIRTGSITYKSLVQGGRGSGVQVDRLIINAL